MSAKPGSHDGGIYPTIVADPPWPYEMQPGPGGRARGDSTFLPYGTMSLDEIRLLPVRDLSDNLDQDGHLYLWTTNRFLEQSFSVARAWGFYHSATIVWCKPLMGEGMGGIWPSNVEFILFCRRPAAGSLVVTRWLREQLKSSNISRRQLMSEGHYSEGQLVHWLAGAESVGPGVPSLEEWKRLKKIVGFSNDMDELVVEIHARKKALRAVPLKRTPSRWFEWPRGRHSQKPDAFFDLFVQVSPGPYLELFARRQRLGWDTWGNEALEHVELSA